jgi:hypothetical protein
VHNVSVRLPDALHHVREYAYVIGADMTTHRHPSEPERERGRKLAQHRLGARAAGVRIRDQADSVAARDLFSGQIEHVAEEPTDRCAEHMEDIQGCHRARNLSVRIESNLKPKACFSLILRYFRLATGSPHSDG